MSENTHTEEVALYELEQALEIALMHVRRDIRMVMGQEKRPVHDNDLLDQHRYRVAAMQLVLGCFAKPGIV
jgi:hypothetical protein